MPDKMRMVEVDADFFITVDMRKLRKKLWRLRLALPLLQLACLIGGLRIEFITGDE